MSRQSPQFRQDMARLPCTGLAREPVSGECNDCNLLQYKYARISFRVRIPLSLTAGTEAGTTQAPQSSLTRKT